jgi:hypothetical protein
MSITYNPITNFTAKDTMSNTNPSKVLSGVPFDVEFNAISAAFQLSAPTLNPSFTGTVTTPALSVTGEATVGTLNGSDSSTWDSAANTVTAGAASWDEAYGWGDHGVEGYATETFVTSQGYITAGETSDTTYSAGTNLNLVGTTFNLNDDLVDLTAVDSVEINNLGEIAIDPSANLTKWSIVANEDKLYINRGNQTLLKLESNGNLTVSGNVTAYGTP